ncbi:MAG TPA: glycosyltransferase family 4 protein [Terriglobales bacterium]|nr:glycosyltransferase family 4 protein [Terriglobales bacterium]
MNPHAGPFSVLLISHSYPPVIGGSEVEAQRVSAALIRRGHRIRVVCAGGPPMPPARDWVDPKGVPVRIYGERWVGPARDVVFALRTALMLIRERRRYQLVYFLMQGLQLAVCLPVARALRKPIIMKVSGSGVLPMLGRSSTGRLELRWLRRWAARLLILNDGMRAEAIASGFPAHKVAWMPNPVDTAEFTPCGETERQRLRTKWNLPSQAVIVLYCGRLSPVKGLPCLLEGFAAAAAEMPHAILVMVGDGPMRAALEQQCIALGLPPEQIRFVGPVPPGEVPEWTRLADIFAITSPSEGFSCALAEAMATGLACLACEIPANRQLIRSGENGALVPVGDAAAVAAGLRELISGAELRARLGSAARALIMENYTVDEVAGRYEDLFGEVLEGRPCSETEYAARRRAPAKNT